MLLMRPEQPKECCVRELLEWLKKLPCDERVRQLTVFHEQLKARRKELHRQRRKKLRVCRQEEQFEHEAEYERYADFYRAVCYFVFK